MSKQYVSNIPNMDHPSNIKKVGGGAKLKPYVAPAPMTAKEQFADRMARQSDAHLNRPRGFIEPANPEYYKNQCVLDSQAAQNAYPSYLTGETAPLQGDSGYPARYQWDTSQQENVSIAILTLEEANEYLDLLIKDTHGQLSTGKDYTGVGMGLKGAYEVTKELGGWGAASKAVNINGVMNIVVENYKSRYLDLGIRWQEATPQMLKIGHALNTVQGNVNFLKGNIYVEIVFSGAVNSVDYMLHHEKTLGEVVGQFTADVAKGVVAGIVAQGATLILRAGLMLAFAAPPTALLLGFFAISAFYIGKKVSELDNQYKYTEKMKKEIEILVDEN